ncbi:MAG TPA: TasA family protein [Ardenticatenaceae bacterium]|nr:TasA family protein [Ardenticatenaceae bacterium]
MNTLLSRFARLAHRRVLLGLVLAIGVLSPLAGLGTLAYFTTSANSNNNTFVAGSIELDLTDGNETDQDTVTASITASNDDWRPGEVRYAPITVENNGTLAMTYDLAYTAADSGTTPDGASAALTHFLDLSVKTGGTAAQCTSTDWGNAAWTTTIATAQDLSTAGATLASDRSLAVSGSEVLCLKVEFENAGNGTENAGQGGTSTIGFSFSGEQTAAD